MSRSRVRLALGGLGLIAAMAVVFSSAARLPLIADDYSYLDTVQQPGWWHSGQVWSIGGELFRPILFLWFGLLHTVFGLHPLPFHIATALVVITAGVLTGAVARRLGLRSGAYAAIIFYCLHAAMTTPIGWASAANSPVAIALALGALYCMLRPRLRAIDVAGACALFALAVISREVVTVMPAILVLTRYLVEHERPPWQRLKRSVVVSLPLWLVLLTYLGIRRLSGFQNPTDEYTQRFGTHGLTNLGRLMQIATDLEPFSRPGVYSALVIFLWAAMIGLCAMAAFRSRRYQGIVGLSWALLAVLPVIFLAVHRMEFYYVDFAIPGLALAVGTVFEWAAEALPNPAATILAVGCFAVLVLVSFNTARVEERSVLGPSAASTAQLIRQVRRENPDPSEESTIIVRGSPPDGVRWLTARGSLFRVLFHDPALQFAFVDAKPESALPADLHSRIAALKLAPPADDAGFANLKFVPTSVEANSCNTRCELLARQRRTDLPGLPAGGWQSAYDSVSTGDASTLLVDHLVPLREAWRSGASQWDRATRAAFANDLSSPELILVDGPTFAARLTADPTMWVPSNRNDWCDYVSDWVTVKLRWGLTADQAEVDTLRTMATTMHCS